MNLTKVDTSQQPFEYACHEGNYGLRNILTAARAEERAAKEGSREGDHARRAGGRGRRKRALKRATRVRARSASVSSAPAGRVDRASEPGSARRNVSLARSVDRFGDPKGVETAAASGERITYISSGERRQIACRRPRHASRGCCLADWNARALVIRLNDAPSRSSIATRSSPSGASTFENRWRPLNEGAS